MEIQKEIIEDIIYSLSSIIGDEFSYYQNKELFEEIEKILQEQHNRTKVACAGACLKTTDENNPTHIVSIAFHNVCMNI